MWAKPNSLTFEGRQLQQVCWKAPQAVAIRPQPGQTLQASTAWRQLLQLVVCQAELPKGLHATEPTLALLTESRQLLTRRHWDTPGPRDGHFIPCSAAHQATVDFWLIFSQVSTTRTRGRLRVSRDTVQACQAPWRCAACISTQAWLTLSWNSSGGMERSWLPCSMSSCSCWSCPSAGDTVRSWLPCRVNFFRAPAGL